MTDLIQRLRKDNSVFELETYADEAADALEKQQAEIERLNGYIQKANMDVTEALVELEALKAQAAKDAADAGRYRWTKVTTIRCNQIHLLNTELNTNGGEL